MEAPSSLHQLLKRVTATAGSATTTSSSVSAFLCTLVPLFLISLVYVALFCLFREKYQRIYAPRTYLGRFGENHRTPRQSKGMLSWVHDLYAIPDSYIMNHQSLDGYLYVRFYKVIIILCLVGAIITWPILFPVNATGGGGQTGFDILSFSNVVDANRYYAQALLAWIFFSIVMIVIARETLYYIQLRQAYLVSPRVASQMSARTVVFTDVPEEYRNEDKLRLVLPLVKHVWQVTDCKDLEKMIKKERDKTAMKLESAECKLSKVANKQRLKLKKKGETFEDPIQWVDQNKRPTHKTGFLGLIGPKVDTIEWSRDHLQTVIPQVENLQATHWNGKATTVSAVIVEFQTVQAAQSAYYQRVWKKGKSVQPRAIGVGPDQIVWKNLGMNWKKRSLMYIAASCLVALLIWLWVPLVAFIGVISNINYLDTISFLTWIADIPSVILGVITGLLPSVLLAIIMALVPVFLRLFAKLAGAATLAEVETMTQGWYFWFQLIIVFLLTTFVSGAASVGSEIASDPSSAPALLAENLPKASNFYIEYFIVFGLGVSASSLFNVAAVAVYIVLGALLDSTPRKKYKRYTKVGGIGWGSVYPKYTTIAIIALAYSMIAPLVLGFAVVGLLLLYVVFRYDLVYVLDTTNINMQGTSYGKALQQLTAGVYLGEGCLAALFAIETASETAAVGPLVLMIALLVTTILFHLAMNRAFKPLFMMFPEENTAKSMSLEDGYGRRRNSAGDENPFMHNGEHELSNSGVHELNLPKTQPRLTKMIVGIVEKVWPIRLFEFASYLQDPLPDYTSEVRKEAYLNPAITSPTPLLWIVHDDMGISTREKEESGKVIGVTDSGAWWAEDKKGKLTTIWMDVDSHEKETAMVREAPVYEDKVEY